LRDSGDNVSFVLVGQGPEKIHLQGLVGQMGIRNVIFLPPVPKQAMPTLLGAMDALYIESFELLLKFGKSSFLRIP
jgi:glycosyltransferase involved in cell wall biosynthesis